MDYSNIPVELTKEQYEFCQKWFRGMTFMKIKDGKYLIKTENTKVLNYLDKFVINKKP